MAEGRGRAKAITAEVLVDEVRFILKTLLRDDLFGDRVALAEAEKLLDNSLSVAFADYATFLRDQGLISIDRRRGNVQVEPLGKSAAVGGPDPALIAQLAAHFSSRITPGGGKVAERLPPGAGDPGMTQPLPVMKGKGRPPKMPAPTHVTTPPEPPPQSQPFVARPTVTGVRYDLGPKIGEGSMGLVFKADDLTLERQVALKELGHVFDYVTYIPREELRRRLKEATLAQAQLSSPHVLDVVDLDFAAHVPHVVTRFAAGGNLAERLERAKHPDEAFPVEVALRILQQCAAGLAHAHARGVVHGGLKPENILFDEAGNVMLSDFGLTRVTEKGALTGPPVYVGAGATSYMAPEQLHAEQVTPEGDVYALGILLYQMLTGQLPGRRSPMPSEKNDGVTEAIDDLFDRMTRDAVEERVATAEAVLEELFEALSKPADYAPGALVLHTTDPWPAPDALPPESPAEVELEADAEDEDAAAADAATDDAALSLSSAEAEALADIPSEELSSDALVSAEG